MLMTCKAVTFVKSHKNVFLLLLKTEIKKDAQLYVQNINIGFILFSKILIIILAIY